MVLENVLQGRPYFGGFEGAMWLYGPQIHLWFLPFVVMAGAATYALARLVSRWRFPRVPKRYNFVLAIALVAGCMTPFVVPLSLEVAWPFQQWIFGAVAIPLGFVLASIFGQDAKVPSGLLPIPFAIGVAVVAWSQGTVEWVVALRYGIALLLLGVLAVYRSRVASKRVAAVSVLMMGVYILHPAVFQWLVRPGWEAVLGSAPPAGSVWDFPRLEGGPLTEATLSVALTFGLTLIIVRLLRATPLQRFL
jgi:surface polysaccharide O-acyltransferase-like enzyme